MASIVLATKKKFGKQATTKELIISQGSVTHQLVSMAYLFAASIDIHD